MNVHVTRPAIIALALLGVGCATATAPGPGAPAREIACDAVGDLSSESSDEPFEIVFRNTRADTVGVHWINYEGVEELRRSLAPGESWPQRTYVTHPWVVRDPSGQCVAAYNSSSRVLVDIR